MNRKVIIAVSGALGVILITALLCWLMPSERGEAVFLSFVESRSVEAHPGRSEKVTFAVTNIGSSLLSLQIAAIEVKQGGEWTADTNAHPARLFKGLGKLGPNRMELLSFEIPQANGTRRLRVLVSKKAPVLQKARFAWLRFYANLRGAKFNQIWFDNLYSPAYEVVTPEIPPLRRREHP